MKKYIIMAVSLAIIVVSAFVHIHPAVTIVAGSVLGFITGLIYAVRKLASAVDKVSKSESETLLMLKVTEESLKSR